MTIGILKHCMFGLNPIKRWGQGRVFGKVSNLGRRYMVNETSTDDLFSVSCSVLNPTHLREKKANGD